MMIIIIPISYKETGSPVLQDSNLVVQKTTSWGRVHIFFISKMAVATARDAEGCCVVGCADLQKRPWTKWWKTNLSFWNGTFSFDMLIWVFLGGYELMSATFIYGYWLFQSPGWRMPFVKHIRKCCTSPKNTLHDRILKYHFSSLQKWFRVLQSFS